MGQAVNIRARSAAASIVFFLVIFATKAALGQTLVLGPQPIAESPSPATAAPMVEPEESADSAATGRATPVLGPGCFPQCRPGFACFQDRCVSACNPLCAAHERCTAQGLCESSLGAEPAPVLAQPAPLPNAVPPESEPWRLEQAARWQSRKDREREIARRKEVRVPLRIFLGAALGGKTIGATFGGSRAPRSWDHWVLSPAVVLGLRKHFGAVFSTQARLGAYLESDGIFGLEVDTTLRLGPVSWPFPWFLGLGPGAELFVIPGTGSIGRFAAVVESGFVFGNEGQFELAVRAKGQPDSRSHLAGSARLFFGMAL